MTDGRHGAMIVRQYEECKKKDQMFAVRMESSLQLAVSAGCVLERVGHDESVELLAVLEVFGEQAIAAEFDRAGDDEAVPPRQRVAIFEVPCGCHGVVVDDRRAPRLEVSDVVACGRLRPRHS